MQLEETSNIRALTINEENLEEVCYSFLLGSLRTKIGGSSDYIQHRIKCGIHTFGIPSPIW